MKDYAPKDPTGKILTTGQMYYDFFRYQMGFADRFFALLSRSDLLVMKRPKVHPFGKLLLFTDVYNKIKRLETNTTQYSFYSCLIEEYRYSTKKYYEILFIGEK